MLKCPHCGARVKGPDLLTGVCSACQQRLTASVSLGTGVSAPPDKTFLSDESSGDVGASLEGSSVDVAPSDSEAKVLSDPVGGGFDLGLTPAVAADGVSDRDTGTESVSAEEEAGSSSQPDESVIRTLVSDAWSDDSSASAAVDDDSGRTYVSAEHDSDDDQASLRTIGLDGVELPESSERETSEADDSGRTLVSESFDAGEDTGGQTLVSEDVPEAIIRTLQSNWEGSDPDERPNRTLKGKEHERVKSPKSTLVIKVRELRDVQVTPSSAGSEPEYELLRVLGEGGMGIVYEARQTSIDRQVALKMIKGAASKQDKQKAKFLAEAVVTGDLDHPNIVPIYDVGRNDQGALFYSMKKVQGTPWDDVIGTKSLSENVEILLRVADAVAFAHARGVVHRDLKPENTMLGEFGEVLVMDWGLAQASKRFRKSASITETSSMGGTPAYMAPEMATGPLDKITPLSDVYLLGAILYEILTGKPPHQGKNAMKCLMAAARNEIAPSDTSGELVDIALKAMATDPADRYQDVRSFQAAIRDYQSHSESILLSSRAEDDLAAARKSDNYQAFAKALFGFEEAHELWSGNRRAETGIVEAQRAYAESARRKGDFDLGLSLLDEQNPDHQPLRQQLLADRQEREARKHRLAAAKRMAIGLAAAFTAAVTIGFFWISYEADRARQAEAVARQEKEAADGARKQESLAKEEAVIARDEAVTAKDLAVTRQQEAEQARREEQAARDLAETKRVEAEMAREQERLAKQQEEYAAYIAQIGLAAAKIDENAFETARELLQSCKPELRNWEWGRLMHLCSQSSRTFTVPAPLEALAVSLDGTQFATGGWDGTARIWDRAAGRVLHELKHGGLYVHAVAFSPDGRQLATGSDDPQGYVQLWDVATGQRTATLTGHEDGVLSVAFSRDGAKLLTASYDKTARLWDVASGRELRTLRGHTWWVWQAAFSPEESEAVTVSQDGTALVWSLTDDRRSPAFTGHRGPVYCAAFSPDGRSVVTGGYDRRILIWQPDDIAPANFRNLERGGSVVPPAKHRELAGHATAVRTINFSADGELLVSGGQDNTVRLWDFAAGTPLKTFRGHDGWVQGAALSPDGRTLLSASHDATVREWNIAGYEELRALQGRQLAGHDDAVLAAAFSPDQSLVVTASRDRTARTWDARTGLSQRTFEEGHAFLASTAVFFDHGRRLLTAAVDNTARVWDVATGTQLARLDRTGRAAAAAVSHDERWFVTGGNDRQAQLWDAATGQLLKTFPDHQAEVTAVAFSADDKLLLVGDAKGTAVVWSVETGDRVLTLKGHTRRITAVAFPPEGQELLTASSDNTVGRWDAATGQERTAAILKHPDSVLTMVLSADGQTLVTSSGDRRVRVWNLATGDVVQTLGPFPEVVHSLSLSEDGTRLLTAQAEDRTVRLWNLADGRELQTPTPEGSLGPLVDLKRTGGLLWAAVFAPGDEVLTVGGSDARLWDLKAGRERMSFSPHGAVASANFSPDGRWIVTGSWDNSAKIWDVATGQAVVKLDGGHTAFINTAVFSPDGRFVLTASDDGTAKLWEIVPAGEGAPATATVVKTFNGHEDRVRFATFSRDGRQIVTTSSDKTARLWDAQSGEIVRVFTGHQWAVLSAAFSPDGTQLITGSEDNAAKLWTVATGECERTLAGHTAPVASVAFAPDGRRVLTGSQDQAAKLWDSQTGKEILTLSRHTEDVTSVAFSPDGRQVLTGSRDGTAVIWLAVDWTAPIAGAASQGLATRRP
jgi:WD40 repeat protein/serine/threonine protein kinase